jgi:hypothetical protein
MLYKNMKLKPSACVGGFLSNYFLFNTGIHQRIFAKHIGGP